MSEDDERALGRYLEEIRKVSSVPDDEEALIGRAVAGDNYAANDLVTAYLAETADIGLRLAPQGMSRLDAIREANLVLVRLIKTGASVRGRLESAIEENFESLG